MSPLTVDLELLRFALSIYWCPILDIYVFEDRVTAHGDGLFLYSALLPKSFAYPFVTDNVHELYDHVNGKANLKFSDASKREHTMPVDWFAYNGYGPRFESMPPMRGRVPAAVFASQRPGADQGYLFEDGDQQLAILMSSTVQTFVSE